MKKNQAVYQSVIDNRMKWLLIITAFLFIAAYLLAEDNNLTQARELKRNVTSPKTFTVSYPLPTLYSPGVPQGYPLVPGRRALSLSNDDSSNEVKYAEIAVNILGPNFRPIRTYILREQTSIDNVVTLWDGRDSYGRDMPAGDYYAQLSIVYSDGEKETKVFKFKK